MSDLEDLIVQFVHTGMYRNPETIDRLVEEINRYGDSLLDQIHRSVERLDSPFDLQSIYFDLLREARASQVSTREILFGIQVALRMYRMRKRQEPTLLPIWTGPIHMESPITHKTYDTVKRLFKTAKHDILIVGYTFSLDHEPVKDLFHEITHAAARGCRIDIIYHNNDTNLERILELWPPNIILPRLYYWRGSQDTELASLHSKLIMIDQKQLLLTSANFTLHGFHKNIETGILIENHPLVQHFWEQFRSLLFNHEMVKYQKK